MQSTTSSLLWLAASSFTSSINSGGAVKPTTFFTCARNKMLSEGSKISVVLTLEGESLQLKKALAQLLAGILR